ncbi:hypothetical protein [Mesorhizobium sp. J428]|uniref:hypothetical protein n=1 Tax=Mesorhizobium sp. J428 TaxID=2898440 RepID=UPI002151B67D|nr:hypothetical protein [Mesorhizobium sp. J428]MCR5855275.1 hypothetical protein [Mesorhizobium sp. J428]
MQSRYQVRIRHAEHLHAFALRLNATCGASPVRFADRHEVDPRPAVANARLAVARDRQAMPAAGTGEWL